MAHLLRHFASENMTDEVTMLCIPCAGTVRSSLLLSDDERQARARIYVCVWVWVRVHGHSTTGYDKRTWMSNRQCPLNCVFVCDACVNNFVRARSTFANTRTHAHTDTYAIREREHHAPRMWAHTHTHTETHAHSQGHHMYIFPSFWFSF